MTLQRYLARLIAWCVAPLLVLALGLGYWQFLRVHDDQAAEAQRLAALLALSMDRMLHVRESALQALAASLHIDDEAHWDDLHREARAIAQALGGAVMLVDAERRLRLHSAIDFGAPLPPLPRPGGRAAVPLAFETAQPAVGDPFLGPLADEPMVAVAVPVLRAQRVAYVIANVVSVRGLDPVLGSLVLPPGWVLVVTDTQGRVLAQRGGDTDGAGALRFVAQPALVPWLAEVHVPRGSHAQPLWRLATSLLLMLLGVTLASVLGGLWATRRLARSVRSLAAPAPAPASPGELDEIRQTRRLIDGARAEREAALDSLRMREAQLRGIVVSASEAIITADASQTIVLANPAAARVFGRSVEQMVGLPLAALLPERLREAHQAHVEQFGRSSDTARPMGRRPPVMGLHADGHEFPVEAAISQLVANGQRLYTVIVRDITERVEAQAAIEAGQARLQATLESLDDGLVIADMRHHIVEVNAAFLRLYGFASKAECLRPIADYESLLEVSTPDGQVLTHEQWTMPRALRGERGSGVELQVLHKDSGRRWTGSFSFAPIRDAGGEIVGAVFSVRDVTEKNRMADELRASHRDLERLLAAQTSVQEEERKRIARELHDELQQVLAAIKLDIGSILPELAANPARLPALVTRMDDLATAAITSSRRIVNDLRPQVLEEVGLVPALELLASQFMERRPIRVSVESDAGCRVDGEPPDAVALCLYRVAQEALNNVAKHARARRVQIRLSRPPGGGWELRIADDGRGLGPGDRRKPMSFGLRGMAERVRALGGVLSVDSEAGRGVVVSVHVGAGTQPGDGAA